MSNEYIIEPRNRFVEAVHDLCTYELKPGTVCFSQQLSLTEMDKLRESALPPKPPYNAMIAKAIALALQKYPYANRRLCRVWRPWASQRLQTFQSSDIAVAVELEGPNQEALSFVEIIRNVESLDLGSITLQLHNLRQISIESNRRFRDFMWLCTRSPRWLSKIIFRLPYLHPTLWQKHRGGAVLISSPGKYGVHAISTNWHWPLGFSYGVARVTPLIIGGEVKAGRTMNFMMNFDRRIMAGGPAARFFCDIVHTLENALTHLQ